MTENNTFLDIIRNCEPVSILRSGKNTLDCIVNYKDENGITTEYTLFFDKDKISIRNNFTGVFFRDQNYGFEILAAIINDIITNTSNYKIEQNMSRKEKEKIHLKNLIARMIFENIDEQSYIDDFAYYMNNTENINSEYYPTLFKICCEAGKYEFVKNLYAIFCYYRKEQLSKNNEEIASAACFGGKSEIVRLLESEGFYFSELSLERAFVSGNFKIFDFLLESNEVDINAKDKNGHSLLSRLIINNYNNLERLLYYNIGETDEDYLKRKNTGLLTKKEVQEKLNDIQSRKCEIISELENVQMELDKCNEQSQIDILLEKQEEILSVIRRLEKKEGELDIIKDSFLDIDINTKDTMGLSPLHIAIIKNNYKTVKFLLEQPDINTAITDNQRLTPLCLAIKLRNVELVKFLINQPNIDINVENNYGETALHYAIREINYNKTFCNDDSKEVIIANLLINHEKTKLNKKNNQGLTPLCLIIRDYSSNYNSLFDILLDKVTKLNLIDVNDVLKNVFMSNNYKKVRILVERGADINMEINSRFYRGNCSFLMEMIRSRNNAIIYNFLSQLSDKININKEYNGRTALTEAVRNRDICLIKNLIEKYGAIVTDRDIKEILGKNSHNNSNKSIREHFLPPRLEGRVILTMEEEIEKQEREKKEIFEMLQMYKKIQLAEAATTEFEKINEQEKEQEQSKK